MHQKLALYPFLILVNNQKRHCIQEILSKIRYFADDYQKALKNLNVYFLSNPVPFNGKDYEKQQIPGTSNQLLFRLQNKLRKIPLLIVLPDQV